MFEHNFLSDVDDEEPLEIYQTSNISNQKYHNAINSIFDKNSGTHQIDQILTKIILPKIHMSI